MTLMDILFALLYIILFEFNEIVIAYVDHKKFWVITCYYILSPGYCHRLQSLVIYGTIAGL